jgi:omega-6 fatty acid desaturase (delta-12 desaturase)
MIDNRIPARCRSDEIRSIWWTNLAIVVAAARDRLDQVARGAAHYFPRFTSPPRIWLFYVQHQFEDAYWKDHGEWDYATSAIRGSSYFSSGGAAWFTGNIGLHHVHHLGPRIPNYKLERCHTENPLFHEVTVLTLRQSFATMRLALWDEDTQRLVGYSDIRRLSKARA